MSFSGGYGHPIILAGNRSTAKRGMSPFGDPALYWKSQYENEDEAIAKNEYTPPQLRLEAALCAFLLEIRNTEEDEIRTPEYQIRVAALLNELNQATYFLLHPNLYRITVRDQAGIISSRERRAASVFLSAQDLDGQSEIVKIERIDPFTGEVLGGLYLE
jgi:hypothetical protein